jgi:hypothetical protein
MVTMRHNNETSDVLRKYANAYAVHHTEMDLHEALGLYREILDMYPDTMEARNANLQIHSIVMLLVHAPSIWGEYDNRPPFHVETPRPPNGKCDSK